MIVGSQGCEGLIGSLAQFKIKTKFELLKPSSIYKLLLTPSKRIN